MYANFHSTVIVGLRGFSFNGCWRTVCVRLKTKEWKMDVNDRKTAISLQLLVLFTWQASREAS
ncbi:hypothetical protein T03_7010 [Trichinella britovi]|uniref:Uncharacterized protein n=1 Tax=Trichinella britovi TaxID=45882 RepID=A0A0V1CJH6_TRIBR|nr:hypothetical protein T03_7010 [Trichinella britovi]